MVGAQFFVLNRLAKTICDSDILRALDVAPKAVRSAPVLLEIDMKPDLNQEANAEISKLEVRLRLSLS